MIKTVKYFLVFSLFFLSAILFANGVNAASDIASLPVNLGVANITSILYVVAFIGGALMILTPCSAATIPAYFANTFGDKSDGSKSKITQRTIIFFLGFSVVYAFMGGGASIFGRWLNLYQEQLATTAGVLLIVFALFILSGRTFSSIFSVVNTKRNQSAKGTFAFGSLFAIGFSGCAGPILAGILTIASGLPTTQAVLLMFFYSLGMGVPLLLLSLLFDKYNIMNTKFFKWNKEFSIMGRKVHLGLPNIISGILLLALGVVFIVFRSTSTLSATFPRKITDIGYGLQDWLLALNLPPYIDVLVLVAAGYALVKFLMKVAADKQNSGFQIDFNIEKTKFLLTGIVVLLFVFNQFLFFTKTEEIKKQNAAIAEAARPAELDVIVINDKECDDCFDAVQALELVKSQNVKIINEKVIDVSSDEAQSLIAELDIKQIPNFVIKGELKKEDSLWSLLSQNGVINENNDTFFIKTVPPPYLNIESGEVEGRFSVSYITDESCSECYDVTRHKAVLESFGMATVSENTIDIASTQGRALLSKYNITSVPTIILEGDLDKYPILERVWPQVGTVEEDGAYIFRKPEVMGVYKDLSTGSVVDPQAVAEEATAGDATN